MSHAKPPLSLYDGLSWTNFSSAPWSAFAHMDIRSGPNPNRVFAAAEALAIPSH